MRRALGVVVLLVAVMAALVSAFSLFFALASDAPVHVGFGRDERVSVWVVVTAAGIAAVALFALGLRLLRRERH